MEQAVVPRADPASPAGRKYAYAAFISYSHHDEAELRIARAIEHGLEQLGKRWVDGGRSTSSSTSTTSGRTPGWRRSSVVHGGSEFFVFLASPRRPVPTPVLEELLHWFEARGSEAAGHLLIVVTDGQLVFNDSADDVIDWDHSTAAPAVLALGSGWNRSTSTSVPTGPGRSVGRPPGPILPRERHRARRTTAPLQSPGAGQRGPPPVSAWSAAPQARRRGAGRARGGGGHRGPARGRQHDRSRSPVAAVGVPGAGERGLDERTAERDLALLQALESIRVADTTDVWGSLLGVLGEPSRFQERSTGAHDAVVTSVAWSNDGHLAATGDDAGAVIVWDVVADSLVHPSTARAYSPLLGSTAAIQQVDFFERDGMTVVEGLAVDGSYVVWDVATGEAITVGDAPAVALTAAARAPTTVGRSPAPW